MCMHMCVCARARVYGFTCACVCAHMHARARVCIHIWACVRVFRSLCVHVCMCACVCMHVCVSGKVCPKNVQCNFTYSKCVSRSKSKLTAVFTTGQSEIIYVISLRQKQKIKNHSISLSLSLTHTHTRFVLCHLLLHLLFTSSSLSPARTEGITTQVGFLCLQLSNPIQVAPFPLTMNGTG